MAEWIKKNKQNPQNSSITSYKRLIPDGENTETENEGIEKDIPCKWKLKES